MTSTISLLPGTAPGWLVRLQGVPPDIARVAEALRAAGDLRIFTHEGNLYLESKALHALTDEQAVKWAAAEILDRLNAAAFFQFARFQPMSVGALIRVNPDGSWKGPVALGQVLMEGKATVQFGQPPSLAEVLEVAAARPEITKALRYHGQRSDSSVLYKVYEAILFDIGPGREKWIQSQRWASGNQIERFRRTVI